MEFNWLIALGLFAVASLLDTVFVLYTLAVVKNQAFKAASLSFLFYWLEAIGIVNFVDNKLYLIPLALGAFVGSYGVVKWEAIKKEREESKKTKKV